MGQCCVGTAMLYYDYAVTVYTGYTKALTGRYRLSVIMHYNTVLNFDCMCIINNCLGGKGGGSV